MHYSAERKETIIKKMIPMSRCNISKLSKEEGISTSTLYKWRREARKKGVFEKQYSPDYFETCFKTDRIRSILRPHWIGYDRAVQVLNKLLMLMDHPKRSRMPNMLLVGHTNQGKTTIANRFISNNSAYRNLYGRITIPVLYVQAPHLPDENLFYNKILNKLNYPYSLRGSNSNKNLEMIDLMAQHGVKLLIIDEFHHILAGSMERQRRFLNLIKYIGNERKISIVGIGTKDAYRAIQSDPQLSNRFFPEVLPKWEMNENYLRLLKSYESFLPLHEESKLSEKQIAQKLLTMSEGLLGELSTIISQAAIYAIENGQEKINKEVLDSIDWISPSDRKRMV